MRGFRTGDASIDRPIMEAPSEVHARIEAPGGRQAVDRVTLLYPGESLDPEDVPPPR